MKKTILLLMMLFFPGLVQASIAPVVAITSPDNQSAFTAGSNIAITAAASEADGAVVSVAFYNGPIFMGQSNKSPYTYTWANVSVGSYTLTAVATDSNNVSTTSSALTVKVTPAPPMVVITSPANDSTFPAGSDINLAATALETNGTISTISFYNGATLLAASSMASSSFNYTWGHVPGGTYTLTAVATDANKVSGTSSPLNVTVTSSSAPAMAITSPLNGAVFRAGSDITITASASKSNGTISEVFFYDGTYFLGSSTVSPYTYIWTKVLSGDYTLTAEATDSNGGTLISTPVNITVNPSIIPLITPSIAAQKAGIKKSLGKS